MKFKRTVFLTAIVIALGVLLGAGAASAAEVLFLDSSSPTKATGINALQIGDAFYNVTFFTGVTATENYGEYPGQFTFNTGTAAEAARNALNFALSQSVATTVGQAGSGVGSEIFDIGFTSFRFPVGFIESVIGAEGAFTGTVWGGFGSNAWTYEDPKTYAQFTGFTPPLP